MIYPWASRALPLTLSLLIGCGRDRGPVPADSAAASQRKADTPPTEIGWETRLGSVLVVSGNTQYDASVIFPTLSDSTLTDTTVFNTSSLAGRSLDLFSHAGSMGRGVLNPAPRRPNADSCVSWPHARVSIAEPSPDAGWTVALEAGRATAIALDSLEGLSRVDSARRATDIGRLASTLANDTALAFRGIPFFVRQVRRFVTPAGTEILIAKVTRQINQEATPRKEQILLIAEREGSQPDTPFITAYHERVSGQEETIESSDVLAAVMHSTGNTPALVIIRDYGDGVIFSLLTRTGPASWEIRWSSPYAGC